MLYGNSTDDSASNCAQCQTGQRQDQTTDQQPNRTAPYSTDFYTAIDLIFGM